VRFSCDLYSYWNERDSRTRVIGGRWGEQKFDSTTLHLQKLMEDAEMLADVKAYDAAKARLDDGSDELIPLEIIERRLKGEPALRVWREHRKLTQEQLAKKAKVSRALIAAIETKRKAGSVGTWKKLGAALDVGWELLA
jgi:DNA-binding XRE family transcriptional regulator